MVNNSELHSIFDVPDDLILRIEDIAELTQMHLESVRRWCRTGKLPSYCFGKKYLIVGKDFKNFMIQSKVKPRWQREI